MSEPQVQPADEATEPFVFYTPAEVAPILKVAVRTVDDLIRDGALEAIRVGRHRRITPAAIAKFAASNPWKAAA